MSDDIRRNITLVEQQMAQTLISQYNTLSVEMSPYEFSVIMREYRASDPTYNKIGSNSMVTFYTDQEKEDFKKFLASKGISFTEYYGGKEM